LPNCREQGPPGRSTVADQQLAEISSPDFPGERLIACYNPQLAEERRDKRLRLLAATQTDLDKLLAQVQRRTKKPLSAAEIGLKAGKVINQHKMSKHFTLKIADGSFAYQLNQGAVRQEEQLDGIYVIRTSEPEPPWSAADCVRTYKSLSLVERAFRCLKGLDLLVRPIRHRIDPRVRAHLFLCLLAYYVEWHLRERLKPLLYDDEELPQLRRQRHPVSQAQPSESAQEKKRTHQTASGLVAHDFRSLLAHLGTRSRVTYEVQVAGNPVATFRQVSEPDAVQAEALRLLRSRAFEPTPT
jgi:transposase